MKNNANLPGGSAAAFIATLLLAFGLISYVNPQSSYVLFGNVVFHLPQWDPLGERSGSDAVDAIVIEAIAVMDTNVVLDVKEPLAPFKSIPLVEQSPNPPMVKLPAPGPGQLLFKESSSGWVKFAAALHQVKQQGDPLRIIHYGDSQIEGDRMTGLLRSYFQSRYGGTGPGMQPLAPFVPHAAVKHETVGTWHRYVSFGRKDQRLTSGKYGSRGVAHAYMHDSSRKEGFDAVAHFQSRGWGSRSFRSYRRVTLSHGPITEPFELSVFSHDSLWQSGFMEPGPAGHIVLESKEPISNVSLAFKGPSPVLNHVSLDGMGGVAVDNVAMRGSSGYTFTFMDEAHFGNSLKVSNVGLVILQFGGNSIPHIDSEAKAKTYGRKIQRQIQLFKRLLPEADILLVGPSDMANKEGLIWVSYPFVSSVRDAMQEVAMAEGVAYFDMLELMGGAGSMSIWAAMKPPLAGPDHIHFTPSGARLVGKALVKAIDNELARHAH